MIPIPEPKLDHLYQEVILDHNRNPRNFKEIKNAGFSAHGHNPVCGDDYHLYLNIDGQGVIEDVGFQGSGCAISKSSASILTTMIQGKSARDASAVKNAFLDLMTKDHVTEAERSLIDRLIIFEGVKEFPVRVKCATLIWRTLENILQQQELKHPKLSYRMFEKGEQKAMNPVQLSAEMTPNPNTVKFIVDREFLESGSYDFPDKEKAKNSPLAEKLFTVDGAAGVLIGTNFITVTKTPHAEWQVVAPLVANAIQDFFMTGEAPVLQSAVPSANVSEGNGEIERKIKTVLDEEIRPAVARDGGDIIFYGYKDGIVTLHLQGSCSSCPSSIMTLKMGVESRLKQVVPEIKEVVQV